MTSDISLSIAVYSSHMKIKHMIDEHNSQSCINQN